MTEYVSSNDVKKRATRNGWRHIADRDRDGTLSTTETDEVSAAIAWAGRLIDELLPQSVEPSVARASSNGWLMDRAIDLSVYRLFSNGGDDVPASILRAYEDALEAMDRVRGGQSSIPGLSYQHAMPSFVSSKVPRAYMPR